MKTKRFISLLLCVVFVFALSLPAMGEKATVSSFPDTVGHWAEHYIAVVADAGIVSGYPEGTFGPDDGITRGQFAKVISNFMGFTELGDVSGFTDLDPNDLLTPFIAKCYAAGIMLGNGDGTIGPNDPLTREMAAAMFCRAFGLNTAGLVSDFPDSDQIESYFDAEVAALAATGLIVGDENGYFNPKNGMTRAEIMTVIARLLPDSNGYYAKVSATAGDATLRFDMPDDYSIELFVPNASVPADKVSFSIDVEKLPPIKNIPSVLLSILEVFLSAPITHDIEIGEDGMYDPAEFFPAAYNFNFATVKLDINGKGYTANVYSKPAEGGVTIMAVPTNKAAAKDAIESVLDIRNINIFSDINLLSKDQLITVRNGSYIIAGGEVISFRDGNTSDLVIDVNSGNDAIADVFDENMQFYFDETYEGPQFTLFIKAGTGIQYGPAHITTAKDITFTLEGLAPQFGELIRSFVSDEGNYSNAEIILGFVNNIIGCLNGQFVDNNITIK